MVSSGKQEARSRALSLPLSAQLSCSSSLLRMICYTGDVSNGEGRNWKEMHHSMNSDDFWMMRLWVMPIFFFMLFYILYNYHELL